MPRTIDGIVASHQAGVARRRAGLSPWARTVDLVEVWRDETLTFTERRDAIAARLRASGWAADPDASTDVADTIADLAETTDPKDFDGVWDYLYDLADTDRVWLSIR